jgi:site-specific recombinase XerC
MNTRLFFELLTHTGLRISEAVGLTWDHVELGERPRLLVREQFYRGKRRRLKIRQGRRDIPLSGGMAHLLREHRRDTYRGGATPVFASAAGTELHASNVASRVLKPAAASAGLGEWVLRKGKRSRTRGWGFHTFRHTCASLLFDAGKNVREICDWLGHADPRSRCAPTSTSWTKGSAMPTSSTKRCAKGRSTPQLARPRRVPLRFRAWRDRQEQSSRGNPKESLAKRVLYPRSTRSASAVR